MIFENGVWFLVHQRKAEGIKEAQKDCILVKTDIDPVAVKTYKDLQVLLEEKYPGRFIFKQELYPLPFWKDVLID